ncbi:MAG: hypothetical protein ABH950_08280 [Candidatus Altiarchaeota archaeon]
MKDGLCDVCREPGKLLSCSLCGARVCGNCLTIKGVCRNCLSGRKMDSVDEEKIRELGRKLL